MQLSNDSLTVIKIIKAIFLAARFSSYRIDRSWKVADVTTNHWTSEHSSGASKACWSLLDRKWGPGKRHPHKSSTGTTDRCHFYGNMMLQPCISPEFLIRGNDGGKKRLWSSFSSVSIGTFAQNGMNMLTKQDSKSKTSCTRCYHLWQWKSCLWGSQPHIQFLAGALEHWTSLVVARSFAFQR